MQPTETDLFGMPALDPEQDQFHTPMWLACRMAAWPHGLPRSMRILEPSCGSGNLIEALLRAGHPPEHILGIERDKRWADFARERFGGRVEIRCADFLDLELVGFNFALTNFPFNKNQHTDHVLHALKMVPALVGVFPVTFEYTKERDRRLWATEALVTHRAVLPERVEYGGELGSGMFESNVLRVARRMRHRRPGDQRQVFEETWLRGEAPAEQLEHLAEVP